LPKALGVCAPRAFADAIGDCHGLVDPIFMRDCAGDPSDVLPSGSPHASRKDRPRASAESVRVVRAVDDLELQFVGQVVEVRAVAGDAHDEVLVLAGVAVGVEEDLAVDGGRAGTACRPG